MTIATLRSRDEPPTRPADRSTVRPSRTWLIGGLLFVLTTLVYGATASTDHINNDVRSAAVGGWRVATTGTPWLDGVDLESIPGSEDVRLWVGAGADGHLVIQRSPGVVAAAVPAYLLARPSNAPAEFSLRPQAYLAALLAGTTVLLIYLGLAHTSDRRTALIGAGAFAFATPMWSVAGNGLWTHTVTTLGLAAMAFALSRDRWLLAGMLGGVAIWGRLHVAVIVAIVGIGLALWRRRPSIAIQIGATSLTMTALAGVWSHWVYGSWWPSGGYNAPSVLSNAATGVDSSLIGKLINTAGLWVAPNSGLLIWTPVLLLLTPGLIRSWHRLPDWTRVLLVAGVAYSFIQGQINWFHGGDGFYGYRLMLETLTCAVPAYALSFPETGRIARRLLGGLLALQVAAIGIGAISNGFFLVYTEAWRDNAFLLALRTFPVPIGVWTVLIVVVGVLAQVVIGRRSAAPASTHQGRLDPRLQYASR